MAKKDTSADVAELLGTKTPKAPAAKKAPKAEAAPAKAPKAVKAEPVAEKAPKEKKVKEKVVFAEGEKDELVKQVKKLVKKEIVSKDLAVKMDIPTRKLRQVLYAAQSAGHVTLTLGSSRAAGMTVSPA